MALVEFDSVDSAREAVHKLDGATIDQKTTISAYMMDRVNQLVQLGENFKEPNVLPLVSKFSFKP